MNNQTLKLYYTSDTHGVLFPEDSGANPCLLQAFASYERDENTLVLDGGDTVQGSPLLRYLWKTNQPQSVIAPVFNSANLDYYTLGNHDFNYGHEGLSGFVRAMNAQCVAANVRETMCTNDAPLNIKPYTVRTMPNGVRVGIVGIVTDHVNLWEAKENLVGLEVTDAFIAAKTALETMRSVENDIDFTICIYHGGFEEDLATGKRLEGGKENIGCKMCRELSFDLILTAHQHMELPLTMCSGTAVLQLPANAMKYAKITLTRGEDAAQGATSQTTETEPNTVSYTVGDVTIRAALCTATAPCDARVLDALAPIRTAAQAWLMQPAGSICRAIAPQEKVAQAVGGSPLADLANFAQRTVTGADIAITSLPNHAVSMPQTVTIGDALRAYPFPNAVMTLAVSGAVLEQAIARAASYLTLAPITDADGVRRTLAVSDLFLKPKEEHYNYDFFGGVSYVMDFTSPEACAQPKPRVRDIMVNGAPLERARVYQVAMSDYRASGTGGYAFYADCPIVVTQPCDVQELILQTLAANPNLEIPRLSEIRVETD